MKRTAAISEFSAKVIGVILKIPKGKVATYGQIAGLAGKPHAARGVAWILHSCSTTHGLPWHRVLGSTGKISFPVRASNHREQKRRLEAEGIRFSGAGRIEMSKYQWKKFEKKPGRLAPRMFR